MKKELFVEKAEKIHGKKYNYSLLEDNVDYKEKIKIICKEHGVFEQLPGNHISGGKGCNGCASIQRANHFRIGKDEFIKRSKEIHEDKYDYSLVEYINYETSVKIICKEHGVFEQKPSKHIGRKHGCRKCGMKNKKQCQPMELDDFIKKAKEIHKDKYDYSLVEYVNSKMPVKIMCKEHGVFEQLPSNHLRPDRGCSKCSAVFSNVEKELFEFIEENYKGTTKTNDKSIIHPYELDIYIPELKLAFEFNGLYWHNENFVEKNYHLNKTELCESKGIHLIHIYEDDWKFKKDIVKSRILNLLGKSKKIYARKCLIKEVTFKEAKEFLNENHLQGFCVSKIRLGLYYDNELVSLMTFGKLRKNLGQNSKEGSWELLRFCNKLNYTVIGSANKLFKYFIKEFNSKGVISYADRSWTMNNGNTLYDKLGFKFIKTTHPNYYYINNNNMRMNRFLFRKSELIKMGFDKNKTEHEIMLERKMYRVYDSGSLNYKYI
ncbi:MAG: hypothetical protein ACOC1O_03555 [bacterium]